MKRRKIDSQVERHLLIGLITSKEFLGQALPVLDLDLISTAHFKRIAGWCLDYFKEYNQAPLRHVESIYHSWVEKLNDTTPESESIHDLLDGLSDEYDNAGNLNVPYLVDQLGQFLARRSLTRLNEDLEFSLHKGDEKSAERTVLDYRIVEVGGGTGIDPLRDGEAWERAFSDPAKPLIEFPGDAGKFFNSALTRDALIGIQAPEKRGKTWWCLEFVVRGLRTRKKVAFFQVGDLSEPQVLKRLGSRLSRKPIWKSQCGTIRIPKSIEKNDSTSSGEEESTVDMEYRTIEVPHVITKNACLKACSKFMRACGMSADKAYIKTSIHPNSSINVMGISSILDRWEMQEGFIPDVIVIDYADILAPEDPSKQVRDQVNDTWKALRRLSQERHCLVISPTQADAASYNTETQGMQNFSEDKRKLAHVTGMLGLNQTPSEKNEGVMRVNWVVLRESPFQSNRCLIVGQCLQIGRAFCCGTL